MNAIPIDGRVARGERTRQAVVDALLSLYAEDNLTPTIDDIAERVGMTSRTIYHHFEDHDAIAEALTEHQRHQLVHLTKLDSSGTLAERIDGLVAQRAELFETVAPVRRAALANMHASRRIRKGQGNLAAVLRRHLTHTFGPELTALDRSTGAETVELLDLHTSCDTWERLRRWQRLSVPRSRK
ncbi:MAG: TetR/AcrR family transcriptional regulator, partial [Deltaproteobacteria bacterium]|nr:TetR/AcrR family transcriptional regulator [Deltaproteobacteria bacterium]